MSELTDEDFIASARKACANSIMNTATGAYLDEALQRLEQAQELINDIKVQVGLDSGDDAPDLTTFVVDSMIKEWEKQ